MPRQKKVKLIGLGLPANLLKEFIDMSYKGNTSIAPEGYEIDAPLSDSRVKVYKKIGSNQVIVTHRGSVGLDDWWDNAKFLVAGKVKSTKTYKMHRERHLKAIEKYGAENIIGIGHSRAGLYLQELQKEVPIKEIITYNKAVGFYDALRTNPAEQTDVKVKNDFVSLLSGLQKRPKKMVEIEATKNPLDLNAAHQPAELEKLGDQFIGLKEDEKPMEGSGRAPSPKTLEQLKKMLKTLEGKLEKINKGKVYKTTNKDKVSYEISYTKARIKNHETKGEDLIITKKAKYGNELPAKAKPYKAKAVKPKEVKPEPKKEEPKKEEPKPEPKKEEPKPIIDPKLAKIEEFINDTENYLNKKSTRAFNAFMKKYDDKKFIKSIIGAQRFSDFYPTSQKCLSNYKPYINNITEDDIILEPTAGLGSIVLWLLKNNVKSKIIATDYDPNINNYLKESFAGINQVSILDHAKSDYLDMNNDYYKYNPSVIFLNPPFSNKGDKKYYLNFLFKALYDLKESEHPWREHQLFFISPQLTNKKEKNNETINFEDIVMSANKKKEIKKMLNIVTNEDEFEDIMPNQIVKVNSCKDFGGTNVEATLYHIITFGNPSKKEEPKKEEPKKEEPKPAPKKEEPKPAPKKEEPKPSTKKARLENFTKIFMTTDTETINKILKIMINKNIDGLEDAKYRKKILNALIKTDAGYPSSFKFNIEDFLALYSKKEEPKKEEPKPAPKKEEPKPILEVPVPIPTPKKIEPLVNKLETKIKEFEEAGRKHGAVVNYNASAFIQVVAYIALLIEYESKCAIIGRNDLTQYVISVGNVGLKSPINKDFYNKAETLSKDLLDCVKRGDRLIAIPLSLRFPSSNDGHANMLIYRPYENRIERFEPHGAALSSGDEDEDKNINTILKKMFEIDMKPFLKEFTPKYIPSNETCPRLQGFQAIEEIFKGPELVKKEGGGFCGMWSLFVLELIFMNPTLSTAEVVKQALDLAKDDPRYILNLIRGYVLRVEKMLDSYVKKIDANDGFVFHSEIDTLEGKEDQIQENLLNLLLSFGGENSLVKSIQISIDYKKQFGELKKLLLSKTPYEINEMIMEVAGKNFGDKAYKNWSSAEMANRIIETYLTPENKKKYKPAYKEEIFKYFNVKRGGIFGFSAEEKEARKKEKAEKRAKFDAEKKARNEKMKEFTEALNALKKKKQAKKEADEAPKAKESVEAPKAEEVTETEPNMEGSGYRKSYIEEIADPSNPMFAFKSTLSVPMFIEPENEYLIIDENYYGGSAQDMLGMNCYDGKCFNPVWEKEKIKRQILSEYKIWYWPWGTPPAGHIRMPWLNAMVEERYKPLYDEFVARRNVNIGLDANASKDDFGRQMFSNLTDALSYVPVLNLPTTIGLSVASAVADIKKDPIEPIEPEPLEPDEIDTD